ncbi:MAG TPA: hypothetical protein VH475_18345 [Tepidisphaeraceae bacterium]|jgi:hypothetical protein
MIALKTRPNRPPFASRHIRANDADWHPRCLVENLEARQMMSASPPADLIPADLIGPALTDHKALKHLNHKDTASVLPLTVTGVTQGTDGNLVATGTLGGQTFTAPVTLSIVPATTTPTGTDAAAAEAAAPAVPILDLSLGPIHLDLLGLKVDTSKICLKIAAQPGSGNLLGNLLAGVANLLNGGTPLGTILGGLSSTDLSSLLNGVTGLLNGVLGNLTAPTSLAGVTQQAAAPAAPAVNILHLSLGPVDLNLLGLTVHADNCDNGPITLDISAQPGPGNLLGNLLGGLTHILDSNASQQGVLSNLFNVTRAIGGLL